MTIASASGAPPIPAGVVCLIRTIFVPLKTTWRDNSGGTSPPGLLTSETPSTSTGTLETGTDSPVSMDSFTIASPERRRKSAGKVCKEGSEMSTTSPGTRSPESLIIPAGNEKKGS